MNSSELHRLQSRAASASPFGDALSTPEIPDRNGPAKSLTRFHFGSSEATRQSISDGWRGFGSHRKLRGLEMSKVFPTQSVRPARRGADKSGGKRARGSAPLNPVAFVRPDCTVRGRSGLTLIDSSWRRRRMLVILFFLEGETYPVRRGRALPRGARYRPTSVCETVGVPPTI